MNIDYLVQLLGNRLNALILAKDQSFSSGDLDRINSLDAEIFGVQDTLTKLNLLLSVSQEVAMTNNSLVEAMKIQSNVVTNGSNECLNEYDIEPYATDPLHEQKIADILSFMGPMISTEAIDAYIDSEAIGSPVTGQMVLTAAQTYAVDVRLMLAIMEQDSRFGTAGVAVETMNPGNVGNTGSATRTYSSWAQGVDAVAEWLNRHRKIAGITVPVAPVVATENPTPTTEPPVQPVVETPVVAPPEIIPAVSLDNSATSTIDQATSTPATDV